MIAGAAIILLALLLGNLTAEALRLPIPGNIIGMTLLLAALVTGLVKTRWIKEFSEFLLSNMALFFVPAGVSMIAHLGLIGRELMPITIATVLSTFIVMGVTGLAAEKMLSNSADTDDPANR